MLKKVKLFWIILAVIAAGCAGGENNSRREAAKAEILEAEKAFEEMAKEKGIREAFLFFADSSAAIIRGGELIAGKDAIREYYGKRPVDDMQLSWTAEYVDASAAGDLGYTYGRYTFSVTDSTGARKEGKGIFHTVWKKQADGSWKFAWD